MLIDSYPVEDVFARVPEVATQTDPVLETLDSLLDDDQLYQAVRTDLGKRYQHTLIHGRHSTPVEVILRLLLLKHLYTWSYEETIKRVADSLVLRWFARVYFHTNSQSIVERMVVSPTFLPSLNLFFSKLRPIVQRIKGNAVSSCSVCFSIGHWRDRRTGI